MTESQKKILEMLAQNKLNVDDAYRLLNAVDTNEDRSGNSGYDNRGHEDSFGRSTTEKVKSKYLRVTINPNPETGEGDKVNVRVPMSLIRAGLKLTSLIPPEALDKANSALREKGINFDVRNIKQDDIEELIDALGDMEVDIIGGRGERTKVFVE
jgi:hypothetical protein